MNYYLCKSQSYEDKLWILLVLYYIEMHVNDLPEMIPESKEWKLNLYLSLKEQSEKELLDLLHSKDLSAVQYRKLLESSQDWYREFLNSLNKKETEWQTEIPFINK